MKRSLRSAARRAGAPLLGPVDRRLADLEARQRAELERLDERLEIDLRILDEHLLAVRRATRRFEQPASAAALMGEALEHALTAGPGHLLLVAAPGTELAIPDGFEVQDVAAAKLDDDGRVVADGDPDDASTLRIA